MEFDIEDIPVHFPYQPYDVQVNFMRKVIESCQTQKYALLESPTGTGKTLSLLCAIFSWLNQISLQIKVMYCSRTHSQLSNVIKELQKTKFRPTVTHIASRSKLCLLEGVRNKSPGVQARLCYDLRQKKRCPYYHEDRITSSSPKLLQECRDLPQFIEEAKRLQVCPYICAQMNSKKADLILSPYTYIVDPNVRNRLPIEIFMNTILVFDEAHNFPDQCSDNLSTNLPFHSVEIAAKTMKNLHHSQIMTAIKGNKSLDLSSLSSVSTLIASFDRAIRDMQQEDSEIKEMLNLPKSKYQDSFYAIQKDTSFLFNLLDKSGINESIKSLVIDCIDNILQNSLLLNLQQPEITALEIIQKFVDTIFIPFETRESNMKFITDYFSVSITNEPAISLLCFTPAPGFRQIVSLNPHTIILTSGTLSPLDSFANELNQPFPIRIENGHVASSDQVFVAIMSEGYDHQPFEFTHSHRKNNQMKKSLVDSLRRIYDASPSGVLTFFPSFSFMEDIAPHIQSSNTHKKIFVETRNSNQTDQIIANFQKNALRGASLLAVCRGKLSEGLDFSDDYARCVSVVGIPYPNLTDYKIQFKRDWLDRKKPGLGSRWYSESAIRAVNQAIGRAIRHKDDYAAIILIDDRYLGLKSSLSKWIQPLIRNTKQWDDLFFELRNFYEIKIHGFSSSNKITVPKPLSTEPIMIKAPSHIKKKENNTKENLIKVTKSNPIKELALLNSNPRLKIQRKSMKKQPDKEEMTSSLLSLFSHSKVDSHKTNSFETQRQDSAVQGLKGALDSMQRGNNYNKTKSKSLEFLSKKEQYKCVFCNTEYSSLLKVKKLKCGHFSCIECYEMTKAVGNLKCPNCNK